MSYKLLLFSPPSILTSPPTPLPNTHTNTEATLGDKFLKNVAMGEEDSDILSTLGELLVERFGAVRK